MLSVCLNCELTVWPPNEICSKCFGPVQWKKCPEIGQIIGFSKKEREFFCLVEFDKNVKIMSSLLSASAPHIGQKVRLKKSSIRDGHYYFEISVS